MKPITDFDEISNPETNSPRLCAIALLKAYDDDIRAARKAISFAASSQVATAKGVERLCKVTGMDVMTARAMIMSEMKYLAAIVDVLVEVEKGNTSVLDEPSNKENEKGNGFKDVI